MYIQKMKKDQRGFGLIEGLLILVIIVLIGFVGYYVLNTRSKDKASSSITPTSVTNTKGAQTPTPTPEVDVTANWLTYTSKSFMIKVPDGWKLNKYEGTDGLYANCMGSDTSCVDLKPGTRAVILDPLGGRDGEFKFSVFSSLTELTVSQVAFDHEKVGQVKAGSLTFDKYYKEYTQAYNDAHPDYMIPRAGSMSYVYYVKKGNTTIAVTYLVAPGTSDIHDIVEKAVATLR